MNRSLLEILRVGLHGCFTGNIPFSLPQLMWSVVPFLCQRRGRPRNTEWDRERYKEQGSGGGKGPCDLNQNPDPSNTIAKL